MKIISTSSEFNQIKNKGDGIIIITTEYFDSKIMHKVNCPYVTQNNFIRKMKSKTKKGQYHWFVSIDDAIQEFSNLQDCKSCNPLNKKFRFYGIK